MLALDVPSGIDADNGDNPGATIKADVTLTFIAGKCGLYTGAGRAAAGEVVIDALELDDAIFDAVEAAAGLARPRSLSNWLPPRPLSAHKGHFGTLCIGGDLGYGGAIALCAEGALRACAGLVSVATRAATRAEPDRASSRMHARAVEQPADLDLDRVFGRRHRSGTRRWRVGQRIARCRARFARSLGGSTPMGSICLDRVRKRSTTAVRHAASRRGRASIGCLSISEMERDRIGSAEALAKRFQCAVVWKGAGTVVAAPGEITAIIDAGNPGMATGGMGAVLTGVIAALRAQHLSAFDAAVCGALLHAAAADAAARDGGERGLLPSDLFPTLRRLANP